MIYQTSNVDIHSPPRFTLSISRFLVEEGGRRGRKMAPARVTKGKRKKNNFFRVESHFHPTRSVLTNRHRETRDPDARVRSSLSYTF